VLVVVPLPGQALATLAGHGGSALPRLRDESLASGTSGAPLLLLPPQTRPRAATEAAVVTAGHPSMVIFHVLAVQKADPPTLQAVQLGCSFGTAVAPPKSCTPSSNSSLQLTQSSITYALDFPLHLYICITCPRFVLKLVPRGHFQRLLPTALVWWWG